MTGESEMLGGLAGLLAGSIATWLLMQTRLRRDQALLRQTRAKLDEAAAAQVTLAELRGHLSGLRHDIRGILSPALLVADRLINHEEPGVRRAGEVMVRTVDRAIVRLSETRLDQEPANSAQR